MLFSGGHVFSDNCSYETPEVALNCGMMLRECLRHEPLARTVLFSEDFYCFFHYVELSTFDIASDAFASFKVNYFIQFTCLHDFNKRKKNPAELTHFLDDFFFIFRTF